MNAVPETKRKERFEINFPLERAQDWSTLAYVTFKKKYTKMGQVLEEAFGVEFEKPQNSDPIEKQIRSIAFWGHADAEDKIRKTLEALMRDMNGRLFFNRQAVQEITRQINENGHYKSPIQEFNQEAAANNDDKPEKRHKREATQAQRNMEAYIDLYDLTFGIGPAGTGKTYVAMKKGIDMLKAGKVKKLLLARPATEAGEKIGYLPGTQEDKLAPYMRPLYDELDKAFGRSKWQKMMENGEIEVVPVGFMRGRTFDDAFIIIDESQNMTQEQLDMAATRIGINSKMVITGDPGQIDLKPKSLSGLAAFVDIMRGEPNTGIQEFTEADCVRSRMAQTIIDAIKRKRAPKIVIDTPDNPLADPRSIEQPKEPGFLKRVWTAAFPRKQASPAVKNHTWRVPGV